MKSIMKKERIVEIDIIRGVAILGIFFVNLPEMLLEPLQQIKYTGLDAFIRLFYNLFVQTKFYTIFSFLFGLGFYIFMSRAESKGYNMYKLFIKRLFFLFIFGFIHFVFLWHGDILNMYALIGMLLLFFYDKEPKAILKWAIILLGVSTLINGLIYLGPNLDSLLDTAVLHSNLPQYNPLQGLTNNIIYRFNLFKDIFIANAILYTPEI